MADTITLWPVAPVSKSAQDDGTRATRSKTISARPVGSNASLPEMVSLAADISKAEPPVDHIKIPKLRQLIAQGDYALDVDSIAHSMVGFFRTGD